MTRFVTMGYEGETPIGTINLGEVVSIEVNHDNTAATIATTLMGEEGRFEVSLQSEKGLENYLKGMPSDGIDDPLSLLHRYAPGKYLNVAKVVRAVAAHRGGVPDGQVRLITPVSPRDDIFMDGQQWEAAKAAYSDNVVDDDA